MTCTLLTTMLSGTTTSAFLKHAGQEIVRLVLVRGESSRIAVMLSCVLQTPQRTTCEYGGGIGGMVESPFLPWKAGSLTRGILVAARS